MTRTKLCDRVLPNYTKGEEIFNTLSHSAGAVFGIVALLTCLIVSATKCSVKCSTTKDGATATTRTCQTAAVLKCSEVLLITLKNN